MVVPAVSRVTVPAATALVPRFFTVTVKLTLAPLAGLSGLVAIPVTWRSGPGLCSTTSGSAPARLLLLSSCSTTVLSGSTTAETA